MGEKLESSIKILGTMIALGGFLWGMFTYFDAREREAETRRIEATKPFLEQQLQLYTEATQIAATLAMVLIIKNNRIFIFLINRLRNLQIIVSVISFAN